VVRERSKESCDTVSEPGTHLSHTANVARPVVDRSRKYNGIVSTKATSKPIRCRLSLLRTENQGKTARYDPVSETQPHHRCRPYCPPIVLIPWDLEPQATL